MERDEAFDLAVRILTASRTVGETSAASILDEGGLKANMLPVITLGRIVDEPDEIIKDSRKDPDAFDALRLGVAQQISLGQPLPVEINLWVADFLLGKVERPSADPGRNRAAGKHVQIHFLVEALVQRGFKATRNDASKHRNSACDLVADAMSCLGLEPNSYRGVKMAYLKIAKRRQPNGAIRIEF